MTTIAIRDGVVAFDSRYSDKEGFVLPFRMPKAWFGERHPVIYTGAGNVSQGEEAVRRLEQMRTLPWNRKRDTAFKIRRKMDDNTSVIVVDADGMIYAVEFNAWYLIDAPFYAIGSGEAAALAAMHCGKSAVEAVEIACKVDVWSGPPVRSLLAKTAAAPRAEVSVLDPPRGACYT